jgi:hypothetical protein
VPPTAAIERVAVRRPDPVSDAADGVPAPTSRLRRRLVALLGGSLAAGAVCGLVVPVSATADAGTLARVAATPSASSLLDRGSSTIPWASVALRSTPQRVPAAPSAATPVVRPGSALATASPSTAAPVLVGGPLPAWPVATGTTAAAVPGASGGPEVVVAAAAPVVLDPFPPRSRRTRPPLPAVVGPPAYRATRPLPAGSGTGRRIVYAETAAHLWVVAADGTVLRDYPVTGRIGRPRSGTYRVYSMSAVSVNPGQKLRFELMVRFAHGLTGAPIGFHTIPREYDGTPIQAESDLGKAIGQGGCVRQSRVDAQWLYGWVRLGDKVVVLR